MATKKLKKKVQRKSTARKADNPVVDSAREIWLAGLGAFSVAQKEGEKFVDEGNKLFDKLVKEGVKIEKRTRKDVEGAFDDIRDEVESRVKDFRGEVESRVKDIRGEVESRVKGIGDDFEHIVLLFPRELRHAGFFQNRLQGTRSDGGNYFSGLQFCKTLAGTDAADFDVYARGCFDRFSRRFENTFLHRG